MRQTTIIIGAGLTGLTAAHTLRKQGKEVLVVEKENRIGGQIRTFEEQGFVYESGPNTGMVAHTAESCLLRAKRPSKGGFGRANVSTHCPWV